MKLEKANFTTDGNSIHLSMPIAKVNKEKRTVSGFATLDNVDSQGDLITAEATEKAFTKWRGNLREQHMETKPVGRLISFEPKEYVDGETGSVYKGMFVNAYVSKGAQDTWEKVLDGTLTGFSLGGGINKSENVFAKDANGKDTNFRKVVDYTITELSLVDNPANQLANIISFQKMADGTVEATGIAADVTIENIFYCPTDKIGVTSTESTLDCFKCQKAMEITGWLESEDDSKTDIVKASIQKFVGNNTLDVEDSVNDKKYNVTINISGANTDEVVKQVEKALKVKGGVNVSDKIEKADEETAVSPEEVHAAEAVGEGPQSVPDGEKQEDVKTTADEQTATGVSEVEEPDLQKMFTELTETLKGAINETKDHTEKVVSDVRDGFEKAVTGVEQKVSELADRFAGLETTVKAHDEKLGGFEKRVSEVEGETAIRKSGDLGGPSEEKEIKKSVWNGAFLPASNLED